MRASFMTDHSWTGGQFGGQLVDSGGQFENTARPVFFC
jgi:hypothetical protein